MGRLKRNKERPPQTIHVNVTLAQRDMLGLLRLEKGEALYKVLERFIDRVEKLEAENIDLREAIEIEREINKIRPLPRLTE